MIDVSYINLVSKENILRSWEKFSLGKTGREDVILFWHNLEQNLLDLHKKLVKRNYQHGNYEIFTIYDPKKRTIHKAQITDRIVHQFLFDYLKPIFDKSFIYDSYASRKEKGTHKAIKRLGKFCKKISRNDIASCWILKCDIKKFFDSIDHNLLFDLIKRRIRDKNILELIREIISSYHTQPNKGLPLGNITSQLFANIYLQELDYFIKHKLKVKNYIRFNDDFVIISSERDPLIKIIPVLQKFLGEKLRLDLPDKKILLRKFSWGIDYLGYIVLPEGILLRTKTRKRMMSKINNKVIDWQTGKISFGRFNQTINSYFGTLKHCESFELKRKIQNTVSDSMGLN